MKYIGIIGTRRRDSQGDYQAVRSAFLEVYEQEDIIISGGCSKGGDRFAEIIAKHYNIPIKTFKADWSLGNSAGFLRNTNIAKKFDILIACVATDRKGGTEDTIKKFLKTHAVKNLILV